MVMREKSDLAYDRERCERIWQRVAPELEPYPQMRTSDGAGAMQMAGAEENPCCMGTAAEVSLEVLAGFIEQELSACSTYRTLARRVNGEARNIFSHLAEEKSSAASRQMAAYYLVTGECYRPPISVSSGERLAYCPMLRRQYHEEACGGFNYARAADETTDTCLAALWREMSESAYHAAEVILKLRAKKMC